MKNIQPEPIIPFPDIPDNPDDPDDENINHTKKCYSFQY